MRGITFAAHVHVIGGYHNTRCSHGYFLVVGFDQLAHAAKNLFAQCARYRPLNSTLEQLNIPFA